jgi:mitochondrial ribonuclease P protein 3
LKLIRLHYLNFRSNPDRFTAKEEAEVLEMCRIITNKHELLDEATTETIIHGLCMTGSWREAEKYFDNSEVTKGSYSAFISRAIAEGMDDLVWKYLNKVITVAMPKTFIFTEWFEKHKSERKKCAEMFEFLAEHRILLPEANIQEVAQSLKEEFECSFVTINSSGKCPACTGKLPGAKITSAEFDKIAARFLDDIIVKSDVFQRSNPKEIERFKAFVEQTIPYDCVIDGLNVAFSQGNKLNKEVYVRILEKVVRHFADQGQKVLVIGRRYMDTWPKSQMKFIKANAKLFLADDL